jgi:hypothetical protein
MAYADTAKRSILEAWGRFEVTAGAAFEKGDLVGYSSGWVLADANAGVPAQAIALRDAASGEEHVPLARGAVVEGPTGAAPGGAVYASDTAGDTSQTASTTSEQKVGVALSATRVLIEPDRFTGKMTIHFNFAHAGIASIFFLAPYRCRVTKISEVHATAAGQAGTATVERLQATEAPGSGDDLLSTTKIDLAGTVNTVQTPALTGTAANLVLEVGNRLALKLASGASTTLANACVAVEIERA